MDCVLKILFPNCDKNVSLDIFALSLVSRKIYGKVNITEGYNTPGCRKIYLKKKIKLGVEEGFVPLK